MSPRRWSWRYPDTATGPAIAPGRQIRPVVLEPPPLELEDADAEDEARRFERVPRNGTYDGPARVRIIPPGYGGEELREALDRRLVPGSVWLRGQQRVRVLKATPSNVTYLELTHGSSRRRVSRASFLRQGRPPR